MTVTNKHIIVDIVYHLAFCYIHNGIDNLLITGTTTQVACDGLFDFIFLRERILLEKGVC
jgi:hypothetical protein